MVEPSLNQAVARLLGLGAGAAEAIALRPFRPGGNNRVYRVEGAREPAVAKVYYADAEDGRDRLAAEWRLLRCAERVGIACVPRPIACEPAERLAIYSFIEGRPPRVEDVGTREVAAAAAFFRALNAPDALLTAADLPTASEACFSVRDHLALVDRRLQRLRGLRPEGAIEAEAVAVVECLSARWAAVRERILTGAARIGLAIEAVLPPEERCISPSDFGFHNAIVRPDGALCFVNFEYAGWDDPAKMIADFFQQPAVPAAPAAFDDFFDATLGGRAHAERLRARIDLLRPLFAVKWCCIMLNAFVPALARPGRFADPARDDRDRRRRQLDRAAAAVAALPRG